MDTTYVVNVTLITSLATHEATPIYPSVCREVAKDMAREPQQIKHASMAECAQTIKASSVTSRYKLAISRSRLDVVENCLLAVFGFVTGMLAVIVTTAP